MTDNITAVSTSPRDNGRFVKGKSGNPSGRPATPDEVKEMLKVALAPAIQLLFETMDDPGAKPELRVKCAELIIDRNLGKAVQPLEARFTAPSLELGEFTDEELRRLAAYDDSEETGISETGEE